MRKARLVTRPQPDAESAEVAAALWYARMASELKTPQDQAAFDAWIAAAPEHAEAYSELCQLNERLTSLEGRPELAAYRVEAQLIEEARRRPLLVRLGLPAGVAAVAAAAALTFFFVSAEPIERSEYATARGEVREITLSDGTKATLGSNTHAKIAFSARQRLFAIDEGQVFFEVAHATDRPFVAAAGGRTVTALGTSFDVRSFQNDLTVTLVNGRVTVALDGKQARRGAYPRSAIQSADRRHFRAGCRRQFGSLMAYRRPRLQRHPPQRGRRSIQSQRRTDDRSRRPGPGRTSSIRCLSSG